MANLSNINNKFIVTDGGNVLIGPTGNTSYRLDVGGNIRVPYANGYFMDTTGAAGSNFVKTINDYETVIGTDRGSAGFAVFGNSNIRIGFGQAYTAAQTKLFISGSGDILCTSDGGSDAFRVYNPSSGAGDIYLRVEKAYTSAAVGRAAGIILGSNAGNLGSTWTMEATSQLGYFSGADLAFTHNSGGTASRRVTFKDGGNVGIGTDSPNAPLQIASTNKTINGSLSGSNLSVYTTDTQAANVGASIGLGGMSTTPAGFEFYGTMAGRKENSTNLDSSGYLAFYTQRVAVGHVERMRINSSGDVGIGTTPQTAGPTWRTLFVGASATIVSRQSAAGYDSIFANNYYVNSSNQDRVRTTGPSSRMFLDGNNIRFQISPTNSTAPSWSEIMRIDDSGNVGIGETSPKAKLNITGVSGGPAVPISTSSAGIIRIESGNGGQALDIGAQGASPYSMWLQVGNASNSTGDTYPILLNPLGGNVGIGTTDPSSKLEAFRYSGDRTTLTTVLSVSSQGSGPYTNFGSKISFKSNIYYSATTPGIIETAYVGAIMGPDYENDSSLVFATRQNATTVDEKMRILGDGSVGINTETPRAKLEVASDITIQNGVYTYKTGGYTSGATAINVDIPVGSEGGGGNVFKIEAGFAHYYAMSYNSVAEWWCTSRGTSVVNTYILNAGTTASGDWSASKPNTATLRITKTAGTYGGGGKWWFKVTYIPF